jgi:hypothetical protein
MAHEAPTNQIFNDDPFAAPANEYRRVGTMRIYDNLTQGSDEWLRARIGILTASEMDRIITAKTLKIASNDKERQHVYEIAAQRISRYVEPTYVGDAMLRGHEDEMDAKLIYGKEIAPVTECGFITNDKWGFTLGYSPDGLICPDGLIECKSRVQKYQIRTMVEHVVDDGCLSIPDEFTLQCQTGLMVSERQWIDFISYSGGLPMIVIRVFPDPEMQDAIIEAATEFEARVQAVVSKFVAALETDARLFQTERKIYEEMVI